LSDSKRPILIVEDDSKTASLLALYLRREGFETIEASDGERALELARRSPPRLIVLDLMLPKVDGWTLCSTLRTESDVPILILSARDDEQDRIAGLGLGADDYVVKPFSPREVVARVHAILRRVEGHHKPVDSDVKLDLRKKRLTIRGRPVTLTPSEFKLLDMLMGRPGRVFSREELLDGLYPDGQAVVDRVVDVHIGKLRQKIERDPTEPRYVITSRGFGYYFNEGSDEG